MQSSKSILLVRPATFSYNAQTAVSNAFQIDLKKSDEELKQNKLEEFDKFAETLKAEGVAVFNFEDTINPEKPDAIFPNNWVTFHSDGTVILYPMCAPNRREERRMDIINALRADFQITKILDLSKYEGEDRFLEGTGSIIFDHTNRIAYACLSPRTDKNLFEEVCRYLNYQAIHFIAEDKNGKQIYHTNVMMCIAEKFSVICLDAIVDNEERIFVRESLIKTGHEVIDISFEQMNKFAGNMLELSTNNNKSILALSKNSFDILTLAQKSKIEEYSVLVPLSIPTIEAIGGGSARCMIAEIFLPPKNE